MGNNQACDNLSRCPVYISSQTAVNSAQSSVNTSTSNAATNDPQLALFHLIEEKSDEIRDLKERIKNTEANIEKLQTDISSKENLYDSINKTNLTCKTIMWVIVAFPLIQALIVVALIYYLGINTDLNGLLNFVIGGVTLVSVIEIIGGFIKIRDIEKRLNALERKGK